MGVHYDNNTNDLRCTSLECRQPKEPSGAFIDKAKLHWKLPLSGKSNIKHFQATVRNNEGTVWISKDISKDRTSVEIAGKTLRCGRRYQASIETHFKSNDGTGSHASEVTFYTRPSKPKDIQIKSDDDFVYLNWRPCEGAEKYEIKVLDKNTEETLHPETTAGNEHECKIKIDQSTSIFLGNDYKFQVISKIGDWENKSDIVSKFIGDENCPQRVKAEKRTGVIAIRWYPPENTNGFKEYRVDAMTSTHIPKSYFTKSTYFEIPQKELQAGTTHTFQVAARTEKTTSKFCAAPPIKTDPRVIKVEGLRVDLNPENPDTAVNSFWNPTDGAVTYKIKYKSIDRSVTTEISKTVTSHTLTDLQPNTKYEVLVKAAEKLGYGSYSAQETIKTDFSVARDAAVKLIEAVPDSVSLSFTPALGATAHIIEIFRVGEEETRKIETEKDFLIIDKLELATEYGITITSKYGTETGKPIKDPISVLTVPGKPNYRDIHYVLDNGKPESKFLLAWKSQNHCEKHEVLIKCICESGSRGEQVLSSEGDKASLFCQALHKGCECAVYIRERNKSAFGEWSEEKIVRTAPDKARKLQLDLEDNILRAKWERSENASKYQVTLFEEGEKATGVTCESIGTTFTNYVTQPGAFYTCTVIPFNIDGISGKETTSEKCFIPLLPPSNVEYQFSDTEHDRVSISYEKSHGMTSALVVMSHPEEKDITFTGKDSCLSPPLSDGRTYSFKIWAMNGNLRSPKHYVGTIVTRPKDVTISRPLVDPTTNLELEIHSDHRGAFILKIKGKDVEEYEEIVQERKTILKNLIPATPYVIRVSCVSKDVKTPEKSSPSVVTRKILYTTCF
uniref:uncharacterized protein LOC120329777 n=1 Tax=Styela clava TaxID=7725 RepID=UPI0019398808|nr:uncharacterized protein LOC120329777 [Styela clava]